MYVMNHGKFAVSDPAKPSNFYTVNNYCVEVELATSPSDIIAVVAFTNGERYGRMIRLMDLRSL
jgi:hypothetical protein